MRTEYKILIAIGATLLAVGSCNYLTNTYVEKKRSQSSTPPTDYSEFDAGSKQFTEQSEWQDSWEEEWDEDRE